MSNKKIFQYAERACFFREYILSICFVFIDFMRCISYLIQLFKGKMTELAEGARLEIVCTVNSGTPGSNPGLSASNIPRKAGFFYKRHNNTIDWLLFIIMDILIRKL